MYFIFYILCLFCPDLVSGAITLNAISEKPILKDISDFVPMGSEEICAIVTPLIRKHLATTNGDRLSTLAQYIAHHENASLKNTDIDPLETLATFPLSFSLSDLKGSYCYGMNEDLLSRLPPPIKAYSIPATLFPSSQHAYWPILSHVALVIPFCNPQDSDDRGYILLDPHLKMDTPFVALLSGQSEQKNLKEKGICTLFYQDGKIISKSNLSSEKADVSMIYYIKEITNSLKAGLRSILAADRRSLLFSRTEEGKVRAYLCLLFDEKIIRYNLPEKRKGELAFTDFLSKKAFLDKELIRELQVEEQILLPVIEKILLKKDLIDELYKKYIQLVQSSERISEFNMPDAPP